MQKRKDELQPRWRPIIRRESPLICPGERYSREMLELMRQYKADGCEFHGPSDASLEVLYVLKEE